MEEQQTKKDLSLLAHSLLGLTEVMLSQMDLLVSNYFRQSLTTESLMERAQIINQVVIRLNDDIQSEGPTITSSTECKHIITSMHKALSDMEMATHHLISFMGEADDSILEKVELQIKTTLTDIKNLTPGRPQKSSQQEYEM